MIAAVWGLGPALTLNPAVHCVSRPGSFRPGGAGWCGSRGRFVYTERLERRAGETAWEYVRRSVRREGSVRARFDPDATEVIVGWGIGSVEDFLRANPEYRAGGNPPDEDSDGSPRRGGRLEGEIVDG